MLSYSDKVKKKKKKSGSSFADKVLNGTFESPFSSNNASKVKTTTDTSKKKNTSWAKSLNDGYDFGDVTKTILGTTKNVIFGNDEKKDEDIAPVKTLTKSDEDKEISK